MKNNIDWKKLVENNLESIRSFVLRLLEHDGKINSEYLLVVQKSEGKINLVKPEQIRGKYLNGGIRIPGEITNSFCTMYEVGYFINALLLNGAVSALDIDSYKKNLEDGIKIDSLKNKIREDLLNLTEAEIFDSVKNPKIPMISWLTDDVETYRFRKEGLWGVDKSVSKKIIGQISKEDLGKLDSDEFHNELWCDKDKEITKIAIRNANTLSQAKMMQYYLAVEEFLKLLDIDIRNIPFYFFSSPYQELSDLGSEHEFWEFLVEMHSQENLKMFSKIVKHDHPILVKIPCPNCKESSKKIINGRVKGKDKRTVRLVCSKSVKAYNNEHGLGTKKVSGCGNVWEFNIPNNPKELYSFLMKDGFSLHVALTNLLQIFRTTAISPVAHVICDLNVYYDCEGKIKIFSPLPTGYGSSAELFTSVTGVQSAFLKGMLANNFFLKAKKNNWIVDKPFMLIAHQSPSNLFDSKEIYEDIQVKLGIETGPQDSGIFKVLNDGMSAEEIFTRSVDVTHYPSEKMLEDIRGINLDEIKYHKVSLKQYFESLR